MGKGERQPPVKGKKLSEEGGKIINHCMQVFLCGTFYDFYYFFTFKKVQRNIYLPQICAVVGSLVCSLSIFIFLNPEVDTMFLPSENNKISRVI